MSVIKSIISTIAILTAMTFSSCDNNPFSNPFSKCKENYYFRHDFNLRLFDYYTGENLLLIGVNKYHKDTVKIYDQNSVLIYDGPVNNAGTVFFPLVDDSNLGASNLTFHKEFMLYLNQYDTDTLLFDFTMHFDANCDEQEMIGMRIEYNDSIYFDKPNTFIYYMDFYKK